LKNITQNRKIVAGMQFTCDPFTFGPPLNPSPCSFLIDTTSSSLSHVFPLNLVRGWTPEVKQQARVLRKTTKENKHERSKEKKFVS